MLAQTSIRQNNHCIYTIKNKTVKFTPAELNPGAPTLLLFTERCAVGFPSPAADNTESELDFNEYCIRRCNPTYLVGAIGNSITDIGLYSGDLLVVDKEEKTQHGDIVIAEIEGECRRLTLFHAEAPFHGVDGDSSHQDLTFCARKHTVPINQGVQSGFSDFRD